MEQSRFVTMTRAVMFLVYLATIFYTVDKTYVMYFFFLHVLEEGIELISTSKGKTWKEAVVAYLWDFQNLMDISRLALQLFYWHDFF